MVDDGGGWGIGLLGMSCYSNDKKPVALCSKGLTIALRSANILNIDK